MLKITHLRFENVYAQYGFALAQAIRENENGRKWSGTDRQIFGQFAKIDPTAKKIINSEKEMDKTYIYLSWLIKNYLKNPVPSQDFSSLTSALVNFLQKKDGLPEWERNIDFYDFSTLLEKFQPLSKRALKRQNKERVMAETTTLYEGPEGKILIPHSIRSAIQHGLNTKWCSSAGQSANRFHSYNLLAPIIYLIPKGDDKFAIYGKTLFNSEDDQINFVDGPISLYLQLKKFAGLRDFLFPKGGLQGILRSFDKAVKETPVFESQQERMIRELCEGSVKFEDLPEKWCTNEKFLINLVNENAEFLQQIKYPTRDVINAAVLRSGNTIRHVDPKIIDEDLVFLACMDKNATAIQYCEEIWRNQDRIMSHAIANNVRAARYLGRRLMRPDFLNPLLEKNPNMILVLPPRPEYRERVKSILQWEGAKLYMAENYQDDREMVMTAILNDVEALHFMDSGLFKDAELVKTALLSDIRAIDDIPQSIWKNIPNEVKREAFEKAIEKDWRYIAYANDCEVTLSVEREFEIFTLGVLEEHELVLKDLYLFPSLRSYCFENIMTLNQAQDIFSKKIGIMPIKHGMDYDSLSP